MILQVPPIKCLHRTINPKYYTIPQLACIYRWDRSSIYPTHQSYQKAKCQFYSSSSPLSPSHQFCLFTVKIDQCACCCETKDVCVSSYKIKIRIKFRIQIMSLSELRDQSETLVYILGIGFQGMKGRRLILESKSVKTRETYMFGNITAGGAAYIYSIFFTGHQT